MSESKLENLNREQLLEKLCLNGYNPAALAAEYNTSIEKVRQYLYAQGFSRNTVKRESLIMLRGQIYDTENAVAMEDLLMHPAQDITDALVIYLSGALSRAEKGEKPKQVLQKALTPVVSSLLRGEWLKLLLFVDNQPLPPEVTRYPAEGYLNQLLREYAEKLPTGYQITREPVKPKREHPSMQKDKAAPNTSLSGKKQAAKVSMPSSEDTAPAAQEVYTEIVTDVVTDQAEPAQQFLSKEPAVTPAAVPEATASIKTAPITAPISEGPEDALHELLPPVTEDAPSEIPVTPPVLQTPSEAKTSPDLHKPTTPTSILVGEIAGRMPETGENRKHAARKRPIMGSTLLKD